MNDNQNVSMCSGTVFAEAIEHYRENPRNIKLCRFLQKEYALRGMMDESRDMGVWVKALEEEMYKDKPYLDERYSNCETEHKFLLSGRHWTIIAVIAALLVVIFAIGASNGSGGFAVGVFLLFLLSVVFGLFPLIWAFIRNSDSKFVVGVVNVVSLGWSLLAFWCSIGVVAFPIAAAFLALVVCTLTFVSQLFWVAALILGETTKRKAVVER